MTGPKPMFLVVNVTRGGLVSQSIFNIYTDLATLKRDAATLVTRGVPEGCSKVSFYAVPYDDPLWHEVIYRTETK